MLHLWQFKARVWCRGAQIFPKIKEPPQMDDVNQFPHRLAANTARCGTKCSPPGDLAPTPGMCTPPVQLA